MQNEIHIIAYGAGGKGMSGGDRLAIEFCKKYKDKAKIFVYTNEQGKEMYKNEGAEAEYNVINSSRFRFNFWVHYLAIILFSIASAFKIKLRNEGNVTVYAASDFWMDAIPPLILKLRHRNVNLISTMYLVAPNPIKSWDNKLQIPNIRDLMHSFSQSVVTPPIIKLADKIFVTNYSIAEHLKKLGCKSDKTVVTRIVISKEKIKKMPKIFDCTFMGRLHPQKGIKELVEIWRILLQKKPELKLAVIGDGPLRKYLISKIDEYGMGKNVKLFGYLNGEEKNKVLLSSKTFIHTEVYGIGCATPVDFMAFGIPGVCFDLPELYNFYGDGVILVKKNDLNEASEQIIKLLDDKSYYNTIKTKAVKVAQEFYSEIKTKELQKYFIK